MTTVLVSLGVDGSAPEASLTLFLPSSGFFHEYWIRRGDGACSRLCQRPEGRGSACAGGEGAMGHGLLAQANVCK
jgi:hypothetical protein